MQMMRKISHLIKFWVQVLFLQINYMTINGTLFNHNYCRPLMTRKFNTPLVEKDLRLSLKISRQQLDNEFRYLHSDLKTLQTLLVVH